MAADIVRSRERRVGPRSKRPISRLPQALGIIFGALVLLPFCVGYLGAPPGQVFGGSLKALGDESVYLSAVRQGVEGRWFWSDQFMVRTPAPVLSYLTYLAAGHAGALLHVSAEATYVFLHPLAAIILFAVLWAMAAAWLEPAKRPWFVLFALGMSGLYWLDGLLAGFGHAPASLPWLALPPLGGLTSALMGVHETVATAGQIMLLTSTLMWREAGRGRWRAAAYGAAGSVVISLTMPMMLPVDVLALAGYGLSRARAWRRSPGACRRCGGLAAHLTLITSPGLIAAAYYYWQLSYGGWSAGTLREVGGRPFVEQLLQWGVLLPFAAWGWYRAPDAVRPLADLLALWCAAAVLCVNLPFWQAFRLSTGVSIMAGGLFALGLFAGAGPAFRTHLRLFWLVSAGAVAHYLFVVTLLASGAYPSLYLAVPRRQAMIWLAAHTTQRDVVLAPLGFSNQLPRYARARLVAGHGQVTFDMTLRMRQLQQFYDPRTSPGDRERVLRATSADLVVYDADDPEDGTYRPAASGLLRVIYHSQTVTVLRVGWPTTDVPR
jgi:hypothetical protein